MRPSKAVSRVKVLKILLVVLQPKFSAQIFSIKNISGKKN